MVNIFFYQLSFSICNCKLNILNVLVQQTQKIHNPLFSLAVILPSSFSVVSLELEQVHSFTYPLQGAAPAHPCALLGREIESCFLLSLAIK